MARYRKIDPRIWNDEKFRTLSDDGKLVFLFLLTHPFMTSLGAMRATLSGLGTELGWSPERFAKGFQEPFSKGMVKVDERASFVAATRFLRYNPPENPNVIKSWSSQLDLVPECEEKQLLIERVKRVIDTLPKAFGEALPEPFRKGMPNPEPEPEPEPYKEILLSESESDSSPTVSQTLSVASNGKLTPLASAWNQLCDKLPAVREVSPERRRREAARLKEHPLPWWLDVFKAMNTSKFLTGGSDRGWRADYDWIIRNGTNALAVLEGKYSNNGHGLPGNSRSMKDLEGIALGAE